MKRFGLFASVFLILSLSAVPLLAGEPDPDRAELVRTGMTVVGAAAGLAAGTSIGLGFSLDAIDTPLSNTLLLTIPGAGAGAASGAVAGRWIADVALRHQSSPLLALLEGAGLGLVSGVVVGAVTFSLNFAIAQPILEVPEGYWGDPPIPPTAMAVVAGGFWGGFFGMLAGAVAVPVISLVMGF